MFSLLLFLRLFPLRLAGRFLLFTVVVVRFFAVGIAALGVVGTFFGGGSEDEEEDDPSASDFGDNLVVRIWLGENSLIRRFVFPWIL